MEHEQAEPEFASLPHFERPFAAEGTVWSDSPELAPPPEYSAADPAEHGQPEPEFAALPHFERPFAAEGTVWSDSPELARPVPVDLRAPDVDAFRPDQAESGESDLDESDAGERDQRPVLSGPVTFAESTSDPASQLDDLTAPAHSGRWIALTAAVAVLLVAAAGSVTLVLRHNPPRQSARINTPIVTASPIASAPASVAPASAVSAAPPQLAVDQAAALAPSAAAIAATLNHYFDAINNHNYLMYRRTFILALRGGISPESFSAGFGTTTDSSQRLRSISVPAAGQADAFVTFVSQQATAASSGSQRCTAWTMEFFLGQRATRYLLVAPPTWSEASNTSCP